MTGYYENPNVFILDDGRIDLLPEIKIIPVQAQFYTYIAKENDTSEKLAWLFYNQSNLHYLISFFNDIDNPLQEIPVGTIIRIIDIGNE